MTDIIEDKVYEGVDGYPERVGLIHCAGDE